MVVPALFVLALCLAAVPGVASAQIRAETTGTRRATTLDTLAAYPGFHHLQPVRVRARLVTDQVGTALLSGETRLLAVGNAAVAHGDGDVEATGVFVDVGRLTRDDQRVATYDLAALSEKVLRREWPAQGELLILLVDTVTNAEPLSAPSVRGVALDPARFTGQTVTVAGRFRGRNLFGDQPAGPGRSKFDFVIQLADASVWVVGRRPRGKGFDLNIDARVDTGRWLEVQGDVHTARGLVWIEAIDIRTAQPVTDQPPVETTAAELPPQPPPQVIFSTPTDGDADVAGDVRVRLQFSRDMAGQTFKGRVTAAYAPVDGADALEMPAFSTSYDQGRRVLELKFSTPFERARTVVIRLLPGITAFDTQPLAPYELRFTTGR